MKTAVILAGGKGTRLAPYTVVFPKPLMPLGDTPILEVVLRQLAASGFERTTLAVGHLAELIEAYFGDGSRARMPVDYVREQSPLGTAGALGLIDAPTHPFLVMNGDVLSTMNYGEFLESHVASGAALSISTRLRTNKVDFGVVLTDDVGMVSGYVEKPVSEYLVSMGVYAFSPAALKYLEPGEALDFPDLVLRLVAAGEAVRSVPFNGYWLDIGRADDFAQAQEDFTKRRGEFLCEEC